MEIHWCSYLQFDLHSINAHYFILKDKRKSKHNCKSADMESKVTGTERTTLDQMSENRYLKQYRGSPNQTKRCFQGLPKENALF